MREGITDTKRVVHGNQMAIACPRDVALGDLEVGIDAKGTELIKEAQERRGSRPAVEPQKHRRVFASGNGCGVDEVGVGASRLVNSEEARINVRLGVAVEMHAAIILSLRILGWKQWRDKIRC